MRISFSIDKTQTQDTHSQPSCVIQVQQRLFSRSEAIFLAQISHDRLSPQLAESLSLFRSANEKTHVMFTLQQTGHEVTSNLTRCTSDKNGFHDHFTPCE